MFVLSCSLFTASAQQNLLNHIYWQAIGNHTNEGFGYSGLDTLGQIADTVPHALSIGADGGASYVLNRKLIPFKPDTARIYKFPGTEVLRGNLNGDEYPDFVSWDASGNVTVLLGTPKIDSFKTAFTLHLGNGAFGTNDNMFEHEVILQDCDSDGYDDIVISAYFNTFGVGKIYLYRGGQPPDSLPADSAVMPAEQLVVGHVHDATKLYLTTYWWQGAPKGFYMDTVYILLIPLGKNFKLIPEDTILCNTDSGGTVSVGYALMDVDGDGVEDIVIGTTSATLVYKGGTNIMPTPKFIFRPLPSLLYFDYGAKIVDVGDATGRGYHSILVADPDVSNGGLNGGTIYLYNIGKALSDTVKAYAVGGYGEAIGTQVAAPGDLNGDGKADFIVGYQDGNPNDVQGGGEVTVFLGDTSYGPVAVREPQNAPQSFTLAQNYPNPVNDVTDIVFAVADARLYGAEVTLDIYDMLGKKMLTAYRGKADNYEYTIRVDASSFPPGSYYYRLSCGGEQMTKMMNIIR